MKNATIMALFLMTAACGADDHEVPPALAAAAAETGFPTLEIEPDELVEVLDTTSPGGVCECTTAACRAAWVEEYIGCDVCVLLRCSPDVGVCTFCTREAAPELENKQRPAPALERPVLWEP
jgi:hypothetical protein